MDIKAKIEELVAKIKGDKNILAKFKKDPVGTVKGLVGVDLPADQLNQVVDGVKAKIKLDGIGGKLSSLFGKK